MAMEERQVLLETPLGFSLFSVREDVLKNPEDVWIHFRDARAAECCMYSLGFVKVENKTCAFDGKSSSSLKLLWLIKRYCNDGKELYVQTMDIQLKIEEKLGIKCCCDYALVGEVIWGIKNVLHESVPQEKYNITKEYCMPLSTGLQNCFNKYCTNLPPLSINKDFISKVGLLAYLHNSMDDVSGNLRKYDKFIENIGQHIQNDLLYGKVLASILAPEFVTYNFSKMFSKEFVSTIEEVRSSASVTSYREEKLTMNDMNQIVSGHLSTVPHYMDKVIAYVKAMGAEILEKIQLELEKELVELEKKELELENVVRVG